MLRTTSPSLFLLFNRDRKWSSLTSLLDSSNSHRVDELSSYKVSEWLLLFFCGENPRYIDRSLSVHQDWSKSKHLNWFFDERLSRLICSNFWCYFCDFVTLFSVYSAQRRNSLWPAWILRYYSRWNVHCYKPCGWSGPSHFSATRNPRLSSTLVPVEFDSSRQRRSGSTLPVQFSLRTPPKRPTLPRRSIGIAWKMTTWSTPATLRNS